MGKKRSKKQRILDIALVVHKNSFLCTLASMRALLVGTHLGAEEALKSQGFEVVVADTPKQGAKELQKGGFDLIITDEVPLLLEEFKKPKATSQVVAASPVMQELLEQARRIARSEASVFITGESGVGKEVIANYIHQLSRRSGHFVRVNCAAIPDTLIESEFFGHEKGAFTGASARRVGRFEQAHRGSLLLDEVSEMPHHLQAKLLRAIQEMEFQRLGSCENVKVNVRLIATSNRIIEEALREKQLRPDLFYRLNVIPLHLPPLRERKEDIAPLAEHFLKGRKILSQETLDRFLAHSWPGNVRELYNAIERAVTLADGPCI
ncbi:MAG: sigma-54-dependent Fis family transcriptional regulator [Verrucomicrobia bacterium]|nr:sigma-54-dependent Fis family transcriptional regulator [Verrucomicrobiota bacterium]